MRKKIAVVVSSHGEVDQPSVRAYYDNMKHIFAHVSEVMWIPKLAKLLIPPIGAIIQAQQSKKHGFISPMNRISDAQSTLIAQELRKIDSIDADIEVFNAFETTPPYTQDILRAVKNNDAIVVLAMNPMESDFSCGAICRFALKEFGETAYSKLRVVTGLYKHQGLLKLYANHIFSELKIAQTEKSRGLMIALHGTVIADAKGNPVKFRNGYLENQTLFEGLKKTIVQDSRNQFEAIEPVYLNHQIGGKWTEPTLAQTTARFKENKIQQAFLFAAGYFADNSETAHSAATQLKKSGFDGAHYIPCINESKDFAAMLAVEISKTIQKLLAFQSLTLINQD
jgi:ferrochelatase